LAHVAAYLGDEAQTQERRGVMTISTPIPATIQLPRSRLASGRLVGLMVAVAALAAAITWALLAFAVDSRSQRAEPSRVTSADVYATLMLQELKYRGRP
jgi:hypothetical protein